MPASPRANGRGNGALRRRNTQRERGASGPVPAAAGIGLKAQHYQRLLTERPAVGFLEVHTENYMGAGGPPHRYLEALAEHYPLSFHGVGLSLGGVAPLDREHLAQWRRLVDRYEPALVSEHVAWSATESHALHDLLPLPYTAESLRKLCEHVDAFQEALGRRILMENPSRYVEFTVSEIAEVEFLVEAANRTGCGLLLDVNNVFVSCCNQREDADAYVDAVPADLIGEVHLAGHAVRGSGAGQIRIDDHGSPVPEAVWRLFRRTLARIGRRPTLIEWDTNVPDLDMLVAEAVQADLHAIRALEVDACESERRNVAAH